MKVLIVHTRYKYMGGEEIVVARELELLRSRGISVDLLYFDNDKHSLLNLLLLPFNFISYFRMKRKLRSFKPDVVHFHNLHFAASPAVLYAVKKNETPSVMTLHNYRLLCPSATLYANGALFLDSLQAGFPWQAVLKGVYKNPLVTFWLALSMQLHKRLNTWKIPGRVIVLTENAREILLASSLKFRPQQVIVKPNFSMAPMHADGRRSPAFLYVGRLSEEKGIEVLIKAFKLVGFRLCIAGDGPLIGKVQDAAGSSSHIEYLGQKNKEEVNALMSACTALIFPSTWYEGMPLTIIEAFASGLPVIASRLGAMEHMITHDYNGMHFNPNDHEHLASTLERWIGLPQTDKDKMGRQARNTYQQKYTPEKNGDQLLHIYESLPQSSALKIAKPALALSEIKDIA